MTDYAYAEPDLEEEYVEGPEGPFSRLQELMVGGDITHLLTEQELATLGQKVVQDWERDDNSRAAWKTTVEAAFNRAAQEKPDVAKNYPFDGCSNVDYPILTVASQQFAARAYPAIIKGDEAVGVKVLGDKPPPVNDQTPPELQQALGELNQRWFGKQARAKRVKTYMNWLLFYGMDAWEDETDTLLNQVSIAGTVFKKVYRGPYGTCSDYVNPLRLTVAMDTKSLKRCPRITHDFDLYPYEIEQRQRRGDYRDVKPQTVDDDEQKARLILEQHRLHDLDGDGLEEPWIITVDRETEEVLRIEAAFTVDDVQTDGEQVIAIERWMPFVKYPFLRDPKGRFYEIGFGHLLEPITEVINTAINQLIDAGHAENAGGGFIASGLRIQGAGQGSTIRWKPGEYKVVGSAGGDLRAAIYERTTPKPSVVLFSMLELLLGAAKEIASIKDVITGDAPATAPVGTTLALIEQGLSVFTSIYKRIYRAEKEEFKLIYECERRWNPDAAQQYAELLDDPEADFEADFSDRGMDIAPVSDPTVVTKMQSMARAQYLMQFMGSPFANGPAIMKRALEAADIEDADELVSQPSPPPGMEEDIAKTRSETVLNQTKAAKTAAEAGQITGEHYQAGVIDGLSGGLGGVAGTPGDAMGAGGLPDDGAGPAGGMDQQIMGGGPVGPLAPEGAGDEGGFLPGAG